MVFLSDKRSLGSKIFSKFIVIFIVVLNVVFTATVLAIYFVLGQPPSDTLILAWFSFTTGELGLLAYIRKKEEDTLIKKYEHDKSYYDLHRKDRFIGEDDWRHSGKR